MSLSFAGQTVQSRLWLGSAGYPDLRTLLDAIRSGETDMVTVSLKRLDVRAGKVSSFYRDIQQAGCRLLPNTAGARTAAEAVQLARLARECFGTNWIKLEVIGDDYTLQPNTLALPSACEQLLADGFVVFAYCTEDLLLCQTLADLGCHAVMPWAAPIGSGQGIVNTYALQLLRDRLPDACLVVDAGIGCPSDAAKVMEMGFDAVLLNTAVARARDPVVMASAFKQAVRAGAEAYAAGVIPKRNVAVPSTPLVDTPFWLQQHV